MSSKTRTRTTRTTATTGTTPRSVPDQPTTAPVRTDSEDKLWAALRANPHSSAADLAAAATIGKSTAQKILVTWAGDGSVTRTPGIPDGGRRAADLWSITEADPAAVDAADGGTAAGGALADGRTEVQDIAPVDTTPDEPTTTPANQEPTDIADTEDSIAESIDADPTVNSAAENERDTIDTTDDATPEKTVTSAGTEQAEPGDSAQPDDAPQTTSGEEKAGRLASGALRGMVEDHLRDHPCGEFSPVEIARVLDGRSTGAVSNALDKLVEAGVAVKTKDKPRRFALAPAEHVAATPTH